MNKLKEAILEVVQEEADTWASLEDLNDSHPAFRLVVAFNEVAPEADQIDLATDVNWH